MPEHDDDPPKCFIDGIDLSACVKNYQITPDGPVYDLPPFGGAAGLKPMAPITITGYFDDGRMTCGNCGDRFMPGPEGTPTITHEPSGVAVVACPACVVAILKVDETERITRMPLSNDELSERLNRAAADTVIRFGLSFAALSAALDRSGDALKAFGETIARDCDQAVDAMTPAERDLYTALIACGTPRLDAICEAHALTESSGG